MLPISNEIASAFEAVLKKRAIPISRRVDYRKCRPFRCSYDDDIYSLCPVEDGEGEKEPAGLLSYTTYD